MLHFPKNQSSTEPSSGSARVRCQLQSYSSEFLFTNEKSENREAVKRYPSPRDKRLSFALLLIRGSGCSDSGLTFNDNRCLDVLLERVLGVMLAGRCW